MKKLIGLVSMCLVSGCCTSPGRPMEVDEAINAWLLCEECIDEEFEVLTKYCAEYTEERLAAVAANGPSPEVLQQYEADLRARHKARSQYAADRGLDTPTLTEEEYVEVHVASLIQRYQVRATSALSEVSNPVDIARLISEAQQDYEAARQDELAGN